MTLHKGESFKYHWWKCFYCGKLCPAMNPKIPPMKCAHCKNEHKRWEYQNQRAIGQ
jgi:hypothetical protein